MPKRAGIRERLLRMMLDGKSHHKRNIEKAFGRSRMPLVKDELGLLISQGILIQTGIGRRGNPHAVQLSPIYPISVLCPMCGQETRNLQGEKPLVTIK